jgi:DNA-binding response OmpR family regulator
MPHLVEHSHTYSLKIFEEAESDTLLLPSEYSDLAELVDILGVNGPGPSPTVVAAEDVLVESETPNLVLVDDETELTELLRSRLIEWGYPPEYIHEFATSADVLQFASNNPVGIAFVDIKLDGGPVQDVVYTSGMEVLKAIKQSSPQAKTVLMSGFGTYEMAKLGMLEMGASFYLAKPFRLADIVRIVSWAGASAPQLNARSGDTTISSAREHILIVDDDSIVSESVSLGLQSYGYATTRVFDGKQAMSAIRRTGFDAILLDLMMPGISGLEIMLWMQKERRMTDVFILSAISDDATARHATELGAKGYFLKPCDISLIIRTLEFHFAKKHR